VPWGPDPLETPSAASCRSIDCIEHAPEELDAVVAAFRRALTGKHAAVIREALDVLGRRFTDDEATEGYRKDGPASVARFESGGTDETEQHEARALRQRLASDVIDRLLSGIGSRLRQGDADNLPVALARRAWPAPGESAWSRRAV
jgi:hypothetical protein